MFPVNLIHDTAIRLGLHYLVIGGHAVNSYCEPRSTLDVDLMIRKAEGSRWHELLAVEGFKLMNDGGNFLQFSPPYGTPFRVDLMLVNDDTFAILHETARRIPCFGAQVLVPSALNLIALKVHAIHHGPAERKSKDWLDIENLVRAAGLDPKGRELHGVFHRQGTPELYDAFLQRCL